MSGIGNDSKVFAMTLLSVEHTTATKPYLMLQELKQLKVDEDNKTRQIDALRGK